MTYYFFLFFNDNYAYVLEYNLLSNCEVSNVLAQVVILSKKRKFRLKVFEVLSYNHILFTNILFSLDPVFF